MAIADPVPPPPPYRRLLLRMLRLAALASLALAIVAVVLVAGGETSERIRRLLAAALATAIAAMLGFGLISLPFLGNRRGHEDAAANHGQKDQNDPRS